MGRILFVTLSNIGDAVLTTPVLERLHACFPAARIDIVADARSAELFAHCPYRGDIVLKQKSRRWRGTWQLVRELRRTRYELIVDLRTDGLAYLLRARRRMTKWQARALGPHAVEQHLGVIAELIEHDIPPTKIWLTDAMRDEAATRIAALSGRRILALGPGANWPLKIWPADRFQALVTRMTELFDGVLLVGGPDDRDRAAAVARTVALPHLNLAGQTSLLQVAALLERACAFVGNDSGLGHIASAVGTPTLVVFGPGQPERYHPWGHRVDWLHAGGGRLEELSAERVAAALRRLLEAT